ncbi:MAG: T9SS type A sorting domain-containing protein [Bacteroidetes bacterium]|nr:T9SS type A sorting domain-containing protein [Bacteroidota bacterium]
MKKLILLALAIPVLGFAQGLKVNNGSNMAIPYNPKMKNLGGEEIITSPVIIKEKKVKPTQLFKTTVNKTKIGTTTYDNQTNASIYRRVIAYPDGKVTALWTYSSQTTWGDRGTAYANSSDGTNWNATSQRIENVRTGFPNLVAFNQGGKLREMSISHYSSGGSGSTAASGGLYLNKNDGVGMTSFDEKTLRKPGGLLWPRATVSKGATSDYLHIFGVYSQITYPLPDTVIRNGVYYPHTYSRMRLSDSTWEAYDIGLPGYDTTSILIGNSGDAYSMDARDSTVAILLGDKFNNVMLWKSTNNGKSWSKTEVFKIRNSPRQALPDTIITNDGCVNVTLDKKGVAHVFFGLAKYTGFKGDTSLSYTGWFPVMDGIKYWNDKDTVLSVIARMPTYWGYDTFAVTDKTNHNFQTATCWPKNPSGTPSISNSANLYSSVTSYPIAAVDSNNYIYLVYTSASDSDVIGSDASDLQNFRKIFVKYSKDGGKTWSKRAQQLNDERGKEDLFPSVARDVVGGKLKLIWQQDDEPGTVIRSGDGQSSTPNDIMYAEYDVADILSDKFLNGVEENNKPVLAIGDAYPNPTTGDVTIPVSIYKSQNVSVSVTDILGKIVYAENYGTLSTGTSNLNINLNKVSKGLYFYTLKAGNTTVTDKLMVK